MLGQQSQSAVGDHHDPCSFSLRLTGARVRSVTDIASPARMISNRGPSAVRSDSEDSFKNRDSAQRFRPGVTLVELPDADLVLQSLSQLNGNGSIMLLNF